MKYELALPDLPNWKQIGGDMNPGVYGATIAKRDGNAIELIHIQPVADYVGTKEAKDVGFPWWSKEGWFDLDDLQKAFGEVKDFCDLNDELMESLTPEQRVLAIAESCMLSGYHTDEGPCGWAEDVLPDEPIEWWGETAGREYFADDEESFRQEVLGESS